MFKNLLLSALLGGAVVGNVLAADMPDIPAINPDEGRIGEVRRVEDPTEFKVCADPDNMPYSNSKQEGFEDKIAEVLAKELGKKLSFQYAYYRQGFLRNTLNANRCDYVMSTTSDNDSMRTSTPYYRSGFVFIYRKSSGYNITDWDSPDLRKGIIGIVGQSPPTRPLADHGLMENARPYRLQRDLNLPPSFLVDDLVKGDIDVAIVWGPIGGYYAKSASIPLVVVPIPEYENKNVKGKENWNISMGVRMKDKARVQELNAALERSQGAINKILDEYGVPHTPVVAGDSLEKKAREQNRGEKVDKPI
jgi:mxaJ protein